MIGRIWSVTLTVSDLMKAIDSYKCVLGLTKKYECKDYAGFDCGGVETWGRGERREPPSRASTSSSTTWTKPTND